MSEALSGESLSESDRVSVGVSHEELDEHALGESTGTGIVRGLSLGSGITSGHESDGATAGSLLFLSTRRLRLYLFRALLWPFSCF